MIGKTLTAGLFLSLNLALHIIRRLKAALFAAPDAYAQFTGNFSNEGIFSLDPAEREVYPGFSSCINCGICLFAPLEAPYDIGSSETLRQNQRPRKPLTW